MIKFSLPGFSAIILVLFEVTSHAGPVSGQGTWETTLHERDLDGNAANGPEAFYDSELDITWLAAGTSIRMDWYAAKAWAEQDRFGLHGWRLPDTVYQGCNWSWYGGTDCGYGPDSSIATGSEMAHLFFETLGNKTAYVNPLYLQPDFGLSNTGHFLNLMSDGYYSHTEYQNPMYHYYFDNSKGYQYVDVDRRFLFAKAVLDGDVGMTVPEPQTIVLTIASLVALAFTRRRYRRT